MSGLVLLPLLLLSAICRADLLFENTASSQADGATKVEYRLPKIATPSKYDLHLEPNLSNFKFTGLSNITLTVHQDTNTLTLNAKNLTIVADGVTVGGGKLAKPLIATKVDFKPEEEFVVITFKDTLLKNTVYNLTIKYSGELNDQKVGFYRSRYLKKDGTVKYIATTHFEPTRARMAFPCWDEPAYKAEFTISITHLLNYTAISNMRQAGDRKPISDNKYITSFETSPKMSTYLVAFVVSDYVNTTNANGTFRVWTKEDAAKQANYALKVGEDVIGKLDNYTGIKYNQYMKKMDQISIKDFTAGAMENWGLVTYRESALHYEENVTTTAAKQSIATIIAHEFAHQWFGNLVSPKWWEYIWLNEGFANYMQHFIMDKLEPSWRLMEYYVSDALQGKAFLFDAGENTRPMNKAVNSPKEISNLFDRIAYEKSGSIIRMMSYILKPEVLQKGLREYLNENKLGVADSDALFKSLQNATTDTWEGKELKEIMNEWITKPGYPVLNVKKTNKTGVYDISQERFTLYGTGDNTTWWIPLTYTDQSKRDFNFTVQGWLKPGDKTIQVTTKTSEKDWIIFNVNQTGYYRVNYDDNNWKLLSDYLNSKNYKNISPLNRAQLLDDALNMARTSRLNFTTALSLTTYLTQETDYIPWTTAFRNLNFVHSMMQSSKNYESFKLYIRYILKQLTKDVSFKPTDKDDHVTKLLRTNALKWACKAEQKECTKYAKEAFDSWVKDPTKRLDADLKKSILCVGLRTADDKTWTKTMETLMKSTVDQDEKNGLLPIMGCSGSIEILRKFLMSSLDTNSTIDFNIAVQAVISDNPAGLNLVLDVINTEREKIQNLDKADEKIKSCIETLSTAITNKDQFLQLTTFSVKVGAQPDLVQSTVEKVTRNIEWMNTHAGVIDDWLLKHKEHFRNSASTIAITSLLAIISIFITRLY